MIGPDVWVYYADMVRVDGEVSIGDGEGAGGASGRLGKRVMTQGRKATPASPPRRGEYHCHLSFSAG